MTTLHDQALLGTVERPLYFLHIPKTAGSSISRLIDDSFSVDSIFPAHYIPEVSPDAFRGRYGIFRGHFGLLPIVSVDRPLVVMTMLREPASRAWSHFRFLKWRYPNSEPKLKSDDYTFRDFISDRRAGYGSNFQARLLGLVPVIGGDYDPQALRLPPFAEDLPFDSPEVERRAAKTLESSQLVGTVDRLPDFVEAMSRLLGRRLSSLVELNVGPGSPSVPTAEAELVRRQSQIDLRLLDRANELLDAALATLPQLPASDLFDVCTLPFEQTMADALIGEGWHARVHTKEAGWHRWTGPGVTSRIELPVRARGRALLEIRILSACDDDAVRSLRLKVQGRRVRHRYEPRGVGLSAVSTVKLTPSKPMEIVMTTSHTAHLSQADGSASPDKAGLAIGNIKLHPHLG